MSTLKEIAQEAGVSIKTVSNVLNGRARALRPAAAKRAERIRQVAQRLNYVPHASARSMRTGWFGAAALVTGAQILPYGLVSALHRGLAPHEIQLAFEEVTKQDLQNPEFTPHFLREQCVDGLLVYQLVDIPEPMRQRILDRGFATVWLNSKGAFDSVYANEEQAAYDLTRLLLRAGHKRVGLLMTKVAMYDALAGHSWHYSIHDRLHGYQRAMSEAGLAPRLHIAPRKLDDLSSSLQFVEQVLSGAERPTALLAFELTNAFEAITVASRIGLRVPEDLLIACFVLESTPSARHEVLPIVTLPMPWVPLAEAAVELLLAKLESKTATLPSRQISYGEAITGPLVEPFLHSVNAVP